MTPWYLPVLFYAICAVLLATFIVPEIKLLNRLRDKGVSKETVRFLAASFGLDMILCIALAVYVARTAADQNVFNWMVAGLMLLMSSRHADIFLLGGEVDKSQGS